MREVKARAVYGRMIDVLKIIALLIFLFLVALLLEKYRRFSSAGGSQSLKEAYGVYTLIFFAGFSLLCAVYGVIAIYGLIFYAKEIFRIAGPWKSVLLFSPGVLIGAPAAFSTSTTMKDIFVHEASIKIKHDKNYSEISRLFEKPVRVLGIDQRERIRFEGNIVVSLPPKCPHTYECFSAGYDERVIDALKRVRPGEILTVSLPPKDFVSFIRPGGDDPTVYVNYGKVYRGGKLLVE